MEIQKNRRLKYLLLLLLAVQFNSFHIQASKPGTRTLAAKITPPEEQKVSERFAAGSQFRVGSEVYKMGNIMVMQRSSQPSSEVRPKLVAGEVELISGPLVSDDSTTPAAKETYLALIIDPLESGTCRNCGFGFDLSNYGITAKDQTIDTPKFTEVLAAIGERIKKDQIDREKAKQDAEKRRESYEACEVVSDKEGAEEIAGDTLLLAKCWGDQLINLSRSQPNKGEGAEYDRKIRTIFDSFEEAVRGARAREETKDILRIVENIAKGYRYRSNRSSSSSRKKDIEDDDGRNLAPELKVMVYGLKLDIKREKLLDQAEKLETQYRKALSSNNVNYDQAGRLLKANEAHQELWHKYQTEILQSSEMQALQKLDSGTVDTNEYQTGPAEESFKSLMQNMLNPQTTVNGTPTSAQTTNRYDQNDPRFVRMGGVPMVDSWQSMNYGSGTSTTAITPRYGTNGYPSWNSPNYSGPGSTWGTSPLQGGYGYPASTSGYIDPNGIPYYGSNQYGGYNGSSMTSPRQNYTWGQQPYQSGNRTSDYGNGYTTPTVFNGGYGGTSPYYGNYGTTTAYRSSPYYGSNTNLGGTSGALGLGVGPGYMYSGNGLYGNSTILSGSTGLGTNGSFAPTPNRNRGF